MNGRPRLSAGVLVPYGAESSDDRSAKIRTYNYPQSRVTDHRIGYTMYNLPVFMDGDIQEVIDQLQIAENAERLKAAGE